MSKKICLAGIIIGLLVFVLFLVDISAALPFGRKNIVLDIVMMVSSLIITALGWFTYKEQDK